MSYNRIPCGMPNSLTPVTAPVFPGVYSVISRMNAGSAAMRDLVEQMGGVWPGSISGQSGQVDRGRTPSGSGGAPGSFSGLVGGASSLPEPCGGVQLVDAPGSWRPLAPVLAAPVAPVVSPEVARQIEQPVSTICDNITPENICEAAMRGCFAAGQVDDNQLRACASSGWAGNLNQFPGLVAKGGAMGGRRFGLINQRPKSPTGAPAPGDGVGVGLSGVDAFQTGGRGAMLLGLLLIGGAILSTSRGKK